MNPLNLMVDETAAKIVVQCNFKNRKLNGFSMMPRFVLVRDIEKNFDIKEYFEGIKIQFDKNRAWFPYNCNGTCGTGGSVQLKSTITVPVSCARYRRQSSILSQVPPVPYSQAKGI